MEEDKIHPEKSQKRPLANGSLHVSTAWILIIAIAIIIVLVLIFLDNLPFTFFISLIFVNGLLYNFLFKNIAFADIVSLSTIYIWRALAGCAIIGVEISPWLTITIFMIAMLLSSSKRMADLNILGEENAKRHKKTYDEYSVKILDYILVLDASALFVVFILYSIMDPGSIPLINQKLMIYSTPCVLFLIIRYLYIIRAKPEIARKAELLLTDRPIVIGSVLLGVFFLIIYYIPLEFLSQI